MHRLSIVTLFFVFSSLGAGCSAGLQVVRQDARGGELLVSGPLVLGTERAREAILEHCMGRFRVSGSHSGAHRAQDPANQLSGGGRIRYECGDAEPQQALPTLARGEDAPTREFTQAARAIEAGSEERAATTAQSTDARIAARD